MSVWQSLIEAVEKKQPVAVVTVIEPTDLPGVELGAKLLVRPDGSSVGGLGDQEADRLAVAEATSAITSNRSAVLTHEVKGHDVELFLEVHSPPPQLVIVGAVHVAIDLVSIAKTLGFRSIVVDARAPFATAERFPHADQVIVEWPATALQALEIHEETYFAFLSHDPKLDNPALVVALASPARYVGALGSKRTHAKRVEALRELGVSAQDIERIHAPIGVPLGGRRPEEIALSIAAEMIQARHGVA